MNRDVEKQRSPAGDDGAAIGGDGQRHDGGSVALQCFFQLTCAVTRTAEKLEFFFWAEAHEKSKIERYFLVVEHTFEIVPCMTTEEAGGNFQDVKLQQECVKPLPKGCQEVGVCNVPIKVYKSIIQ